MNKKVQQYSGVKQKTILAFQLKKIYRALPSQKECGGIPSTCGAEYSNSLED